MIPPRAYNHALPNKHMEKTLGAFPAFPFPGFVGAVGLKAQPSNSGMPFRDYIAIKAMEVLLTDPEAQLDDVAEQSYLMADKMLLARDYKNK